MAKPEWGVKRICPACGTKYYDFNNSPIICPSCNMEFDPDIYLKSRKGKNLSPKLVADNNDNISNLDDIEVENDEEVVSDDDPILEINKDDDNEGDIAINDDINFIEDTDVSEEDETSVEIIEDQKD
ncbi:TIGR02300 family protein [Pseudomonadota bacterium]|nr:TIGR02300 family protein [Pseudomonadota bacterium]